MQTLFVDGIEYQYEVDADCNGPVSVDVCQVVDNQHVVGVFFDHDTESAVVEGPEFQESAPYFQLRDWTYDNIAAWAINQIPGY